MIDEGLAPRALRMPNSKVRSCADGFSYAKLSGSLLHGDEHDVAHAHDACEQRSQTDDPDEEVDAAEDEHHVLVTFHAVVDPDGAFVVGREGVFGGQTIAEPLFEFGHFLIGVDVFHRKIGLSYARIAVVEE